jgi:hypothetical protein
LLEGRTFMDRRFTNLADQYADLQRLRRELFLVEEKLRGLAIENGTKNDMRMQRGAARSARALMEDGALAEEAAPASDRA